MQQRLLKLVMIGITLSLCGCSRDIEDKSEDKQISTDSLIEDTESLAVDTQDLFDKFDFSGIYNKLTEQSKNQILKKCVVNEEDLDNKRDISLPVVQTDFYVNTYDSANKQSDGPSEAVKSVDEDITIVKYYQMKDIVTGNVIIMSYYVTKGVSNHINIQDEQNINGYQLVDWFTSKDNWVPNGDVSYVNYDSVKINHGNGVYSGINEERLVVDNESQDKVLHILYELHPVEKHLNVVKVFMSGEELESINTDERLSGNFLTEYDTNVINYTLQDIKGENGEPREIVSWDNISDIGSYNMSDMQEGKFKLKSDISTLYLLYQKDNLSALTLYANELSHRFTLKELTNNKLFKVSNHVPSALEGRAFIAECNGHKCSDTTCNKVHYCTNEVKYLVPGWNYFIDHIEDTYNYDFQSSFICDYADVGDLYLKQLVTWKGGNVLNSYLEPNAEFTVYRNKSRDKVTLYPKLNTVLDGMGKIGLSLTLDTSYVPKNKREAQISYTEEQYTDKLETHWKAADDRRIKIHWKWLLCSPYGQEISQDEYEIGYERGHGPSDANAYYSQDNNVVTKYYVGTENAGLEEVRGLENTKTEENKLLKFYPYVKMKYMDAAWQESDVYVTSENLSTVRSYNSVESKEMARPKSIFKKAKFFNMYVDSVQSDGVNEDLEELFEKSAINYKVKDWDNFIQSKEYVVCLADDKVEAVDNTGFITKESDAVGYLKNKYNINAESYDSGLVMKQSQYTIYKINTNTDGDLWVTKNGEQVGIKFGYKSDRRESDLTEFLASSLELFEIENHTKVFTNLYNALDRNTESLDRNGEPWYFEAFNGLEVIVCDTIFIR